MQCKAERETLRLMYGSAGSEKTFLIHPCISSKCTVLTSTGLSESYNEQKVRQIYSTIFQQYRLRKIGKKTTPALDFAEMRIDLATAVGILPSVH